MLEAVAFLGPVALRNAAVRISTTNKVKTEYRLSSNKLLRAPNRETFLLYFNKCTATCSDHSAASDCLFVHECQ